MSLRIAGDTKCLGWCGETFRSPDKAAIRFCPKCRKRRENAYGTISKVEMRSIRSGSREAEREALSAG